MQNYLIKQNKPSKGFTLIELLVAMVIVSMLGGVIFSTFTQGVKVWQWATFQNSNGQEEFFFETIRNELRNAFKFRDVAFNGSQRSFEFYSFVMASSAANSHVKNKKIPAKIKYEYLPVEKLLQREVIFYERMLYPKKSDIQTKSVLEGVESFALEYDAKQKERFSSVWVKKWSDACYPGAIKFTMNLGSGQATPEVRIISIPHEGICIE